MTFDKVLITGAAGFIGYHLSQRLLDQGVHVSGIDNLNAYYDVQLKKDRLGQLVANDRFSFHQADISDREAVKEIAQTGKFEVVVNLAAQAGVRYSIDNPEAYVDANLVGFGNILEACRHTKVKHLVFASSSSVYGANTSMPFSVHQNVDHPVSLYAATKKANELMAHTYSHLYRLPCTGLRFFTVYGPWGRPDMALFLFTRAILEDKPIKVYNYGKMQRDFTYIDDIVEGIVRVMGRPAQPNPEWSGDAPDPCSSAAPYRIYNIGNNQPVELIRFIEVIEAELGKTAQKDMMEIQPGDVEKTYANVDDLMRDTGFKPETRIEDGIRAFVNWYRNYYQIGS